MEAQPYKGGVRASVYIDYDSLDSYKNVSGYQVVKWSDEGKHGGKEVDHKSHVWQDTIDNTVNNGELLRLAVEYKKSYGISVRTYKGENEKYLEVEITDNATGDSIVLPVGDEVKLSGDYSTELDIHNIVIGAQADYRLLEGGLQYADVAVDVFSTFKGEIKAEEETKLPLFKTSAPIPLAGGVAGVDIQFFLVLSIEGTVSIEAELLFGVSVVYEKDKGLKHRKHEWQPDNPKYVEMMIKIQLLVI